MLFSKISFRQAERKLKEMEHETAQLRNKFKILSLIDFEPPPPILTNILSALSRAPSQRAPLPRRHSQSDFLPLLQISSAYQLLIQR